MRKIAWVLGALVTACGPTPVVPPTHVDTEPTAAPASTPEEAGPPTAKEWAAAPAAHVEGAASLGCEAKSLRDWVQVSCTKLSFFAGLPTGVTVHGPHGAEDVHVEQNPGVATTLTWRFEAGSKLHASFVWDANEIFRLAAEWPDGGARPDPVAAFEGAEKKSADEIIRAICACKPRYAWKSRVDSYGCDKSEFTMDSEGAWTPSCLRHATAGNDCDEMNYCITSEPQSSDICANDDVMYGLPPMLSCAKACDATNPCPEGFECKGTLHFDGEVKEDGPTACQR